MQAKIIIVILENKEEKEGMKRYLSRIFATTYSGRVPKDTEFPKGKIAIIIAISEFRRFRFEEARRVEEENAFTYNEFKNQHRV
jgi:hypothetical protein